MHYAHTEPRLYDPRVTTPHTAELPQISVEAASSGGDALPALSAATATPAQRTTGIAVALAASASGQTGAALGASAFPVIGPVGVTAVRQLFTAVLLAAVVRPRLHRLTGEQWRPVLGMALVLSVMNLSVYAAVERIGLGLAITLEFVGPLALAVALSRRAGDFVCAGIAAVGVVILTKPGPSSDFVGIGLALVAAAGWAAYILLSRALGQRLSGLEGAAAASIVSAFAWVPIAAVWFVAHPPTLTALFLAMACGLLASAVPYVGDVIALRRVPAGLFSILASIHPVWAALAGLLILGEALDGQEWAGIALIVLSNAAISARGLPRPKVRLRLRPRAGASEGDLQVV